MNQTKPFASLSSTLLARKGQARPAMRSQGFAGFDMKGNAAQALEDLGWNDMGGHEPPASARAVVTLPTQFGRSEPDKPRPVEPAAVEPEPVTSPAPSNEPELTWQVAEPVAPVAVAPVRPRAAPGSKGKAAFTLRLDPVRHLRLRLACAVRHQSAQRLVVEALDAFLMEQLSPEIDQVAGAKS